MSIKKVHKAVRDLLGLRPDDHIEIVISEPAVTTPSMAMDIEDVRGNPLIPAKKTTRVKVVASKASKKKNLARKLQK